MKHYHNYALLCTLFLSSINIINSAAQDAPQADGSIWGAILNRFQSAGEAAARAGERGVNFFTSKETETLIARLDRIKEIEIITQARMNIRRIENALRDGTPNIQITPTGAGMAGYFAISPVLYFDIRDRQPSTDRDLIEQRNHRLRKLIDHLEQDGNTLNFGEQRDIVGEDELRRYLEEMGEVVEQAERRKEIQQQEEDHYRELRQNLEKGALEEVRAGIGAERQADLETRKAAAQALMAGRAENERHAREIDANNKRFDQLYERLPYILLTLVGAYGATQVIHYLARYGIESLFKKQMSGVEETSLLSIWEWIRGVRPPESRAGEMKFNEKFTKRVQKIFKSIAISMARVKQGQPGTFKHYVFAGKPGTGKTMLAKELARHAGMEYIVINGSEVEALSHEDAIATVLSIIDRARNSKKPVMLIVDEAENLFMDREHPRIDSKKQAITNTLLKAFPDAIDEHISLILITNLPKLLDKAIKSRVDTRIIFELPDKQTRQDILDVYIKKYFDRGEVLPEVFERLTELAEMTEGFVGRRLQLLGASMKEDLDTENKGKKLTFDMAHNIISEKIQDDKNEEEYEY